MAININPDVLPSGVSLHAVSPEVGARFHPGGGRIFRVSEETLQIWDGRSYDFLTSFNSPLPIESFALDRQGTRVAGLARDGTINIWETISAYSPEAGELVETLFRNLIFAEDVNRYLLTRADLNPELRRSALMLVRRRGETSAFVHFSKSWEVVSPRNASKQEYELSVRRLLLACQMAPWEPLYWNTLGMAQYRLGAYREALSSLARASKLPGFQGMVSNLSFVAMANYRLKRIGESHAIMAQLRTIAGYSASEFAHEAEELISAKRSEAVSNNQ
jgi:hypothetical protein